MDDQNNPVGGVPPAPADPNQGGTAGVDQPAPAPVVEPNAGQAVPEAPAPEPTPAPEPVSETPQPAPVGDTGTGGEQGGQNPAGNAPAV